MVYKRFSILVIIRLVLVLLNLFCFLVLYLMLEPDQLIFTFLVLFLILIYQVYDLIRFVNTTNRLLSRFILNIQHKDFTSGFSENEKGSVKELYQAFNEVTRAFREVKTEKETQFNFLNQLVELMGTGIISVDQSNKIVLMNSSAEKLLGVKKCGRWEQLALKAQHFTSKVDEIDNQGTFLLESANKIQGPDLAVEVNTTFLQNNKHRVISFQNIKNEIEQKETEAWIKLIRTLNHEIMNSTTPISSLTETILMILGHENGKQKTIDELTDDNISDVIRSVTTIQNRSNGLYDFVNEYRKLTRVPTPHKQAINVKNLIENTCTFLSSELKQRKISINIETDDPELTIYADPGLIQQVLINLIKNSMEALIDNPKASINIEAFENDIFKTEITIKDNGPGIDDEIMDDIFIPFFTTKDTGSGIGLSLSRQIMRLHGGRIEVESIKNEYSKFILLFQNPIK